MSDLVERLKTLDGRFDISPDLHYEAAVEIERLQKQVEILETIRAIALVISDGMTKTAGGDAYVFDGSMNDVEMLRDAECEYLLTLPEEPAPDEDDKEERARRAGVDHIPRGKRL